MVRNITKRIKKRMNFPRVFFKSSKSVELEITPVIENQEVTNEELVEETLSVESGTVVETNNIKEEVVKPKKVKQSSKINNEIEKQEKND